MFDELTCVVVFVLESVGRDVNNPSESNEEMAIVLAGCCCCCVVFGTVPYVVRVAGVVARGADDDTLGLTPTGRGVLQDGSDGLEPVTADGKVAGNDDAEPDC